MLFWSVVPVEYLASVWFGRGEPFGAFKMAC